MPRAVLEATAEPQALVDRPVQVVGRQVWPVPLERVARAAPVAPVAPDSQAWAVLAIAPEEWGGAAARVARVVKAAQRRLAAPTATEESAAQAEPEVKAVKAAAASTAMELRVAPVELAVRQAPEAPRVPVMEQQVAPARRALAEPVAEVVAAARVLPDSGVKPTKPVGRATTAAPVARVVKAVLLRPAELTAMAAPAALEARVATGARAVPEPWQTAQMGATVVTAVRPVAAAKLVLERAQPAWWASRA